MARVELRLSPEAAKLARLLIDAFAPPSSVTVSEWSAEHRVIPRGNAEPGRWSNDRAPYLVEPFDAIHEDDVHTIVIAGCSQSGKTEAATNVVGWAVCNDPCTTIWATPSDTGAMTAASRFDAAIDATPELRKRFGSRTARSTINNASMKEFMGGKLVIVSAGSPSSLASHPARLVIADEVDRFPIALRREGDPIGLLRARGTTFARRKFIAMSSPTQVGASRIEALFDEGDRREWFWLCACGGHFLPDWESVAWTPGQPHTAHLVAPCCGVIMSDRERWEAMSRGEWRSTAEGTKGVRSYRFRGLSSPWLTLELLAREFETAGKSPTKLAPFYNTRLGLPFEADQGEGADADAVKAMAEAYGGERCPRDASLITCGIDVQAGWLAVLIVAWGMGDEAWALQWHEVQGEARDPRTWEDVAALLEQRFSYGRGVDVPVEAVAIDSGYETQHVVEFCMKHRARGRGWFPTKGVAGPGRPLWTRGGDVARSLAKHFLVGVDGGKSQILAGLAQAEGGAGKIHTRTEFPEHFWTWATNEELVQKETIGGVKTEWRLKKGQRRNEVLDCFVLALAARYSAGFAIAERLARLQAGGSIRAPLPSMAEIAAQMGRLTTAAAPPT